MSNSVEQFENIEPQEVDDSGLENESDLVKKLSAYIDRAIYQKVASDSDRKFLRFFIESEEYKDVPSDKMEAAVIDKLVRMKEDKDFYDQMVNHNLIKNVGFLKIDQGKKINVPGEKGFLNLTVPERRDLLKKIKEALPKAELYAAKLEKEESAELVKNYTKMLDKALNKDKIIGSKTHAKFLDGFSKIDKDEKEDWVQEFSSQMTRYENLWKEVRSTFRGDTLKHFESLRDSKGYTEVFNQISVVKEKEGKRLDSDYKNRLRKYREKGTIGNKTIHSFMENSDGIKRQSLDDKERYIDQLPSQMKRYENLWERIDELPRKQKEFLAVNIDKYGYTELNEFYDHFSDGGKIPGQDDNLSDLSDNLREKTSATVAEGIENIDAELDKKGGDSKGNFIDLLKRKFLGNRTEKEVDASNIDNHAQQRKAAQKKVESTSQEKEVESNVVDFGGNIAKLRAEKNPGQSNENVQDELSALNLHNDQVQEEMKDIALNEKIHVQVTEKNGLSEIETAVDGEQNVRSVDFRIDEKGAIGNLQSQHLSKNDKLSISTKKEGKVTNLKLSEIRLMKEYLESKKEIDEKAA